jgi:hypothetical protein
MLGPARWQRLRISLMGLALMAGASSTAEAQTPSLEVPDPIARADQSPQDQEQGDDPYAKFLKWVKVDAAWMPGQLDAGFYGIIGMHVAVAKVGRLYIFGPPGVMLVVQDTAEGRMLRPGFTWGFSYALTEVRIPSTRRNAQLYLTLGRCWVTGSYSNGLNMVGLSVTWKK